jgi:hypothetical protein
LVSVLENRGGGRFGAARDYETGNSSGSVAIGDLNGDGKLDLATSNWDERSVSVLVNATGRCVTPNVRRKTLPVAKRAIAQANCRLGTIRRAYSNAVKRGRVISQKPKLGTVLRKGGKVDLVVSLGRKQ